MAKRKMKAAKRQKPAAVNLAAPERAVGKAVTGSRDGFWTAEWQAYLASWKAVASKRFWLAGLLDLIFIFIAYLLYSASARLIYNIVEPLLPDLLSVGNMKLMENPAYEDAFVQIAPAVYHAIWNSIAVLAAAIVLGILAFTFLNSEAWGVLSGRRLPRKKMGGLFIANIAWLAGWLVVFIIWVKITWAIDALLFIVLAALFFCSDNVLRAALSGGKSMFITMKDSVWLVLRKAHWFIVLLIGLAVNSAAILAVVGLASYISYSVAFFLVPLSIVIIIGLSRAHFLRLLDYL